MAKKVEAPDNIEALVEQLREAVAAKGGEMFVGIKLPDETRYHIYAILTEDVYGFLNTTFQYVMNHRDEQEEAPEPWAN